MIDGLGTRRIGFQLASLLWFVSSFPSSGSQPTSYGEPEVFTDFYRIAVSGSDIAKFDPLVSLNNLGRVAYIAHRAGGPSVFSGAPFETPKVASFATPASNRRYGFVQISDNGSIVAEEAVAVFPPGYLIRVWNGGAYRIVADNLGGKFNSVLLPSLNNRGDVLFVSLELDSRFVVFNLNANGNNAAAATFSSGLGFAPRAMLDDLGGFVFRDPSSRIFYYTKNGPAALIASPSIGFENLGRSPGLSDDGKAAVFFGHFDDDAGGPGTAQPGVFIRSRDPSGGWTIPPRRLAGSGVNDTFDPGEAVWTNLGSGGSEGNILPSRPSDYQILRIRSFLPDEKINVNAIDSLGNYRFAFVATATHPAGDFAALYTGTFNILRDQVTAPPKVVARQGNSLTLRSANPVSALVQSLTIYDAVNTRNELAFWMSSSSSEAIVKAKRVIDPLRQNDYPWGPVPYADRQLAAFISRVEGSPNDPDFPELTMLRRVHERQNNTLSAKGCFVTSLTMALNLLGLRNNSPSETYAELVDASAITPIQSLTRATSSGPVRFSEASGLPGFNGGDADPRKYPDLFGIGVTPVGPTEIVRVWNHLIQAGMLAPRCALLSVKGHWILACGIKDDQNQLTVRVLDPWERKDGTGRDRIFSVNQFAAFSAYLAGRNFRQGRLVRRPSTTPTSLEPGDEPEIRKSTLGNLASSGGAGVSGLTRGPVRIFVTAPNGRRFGTDAIAGVTYTEIPDAYYEPVLPILDGETDLSEEQIRSLALTADYEFYIEDVPDGEFKVELLGAGSGAFATQLTFHSGSGRKAIFDFADTIQPGERRNHSIQVTNGEFAPQIISNPKASSVAVGGTASLSGSVQGTAPLSFQWFRGSSAVKESDRIFGTQSSALIITRVQPDDAGQYTLRVTNAAGSATSTPAALSVLQLGQSFSQWALAHGLVAGQDGLSDDPDQDGLPNAVEFALALDPKRSSRFSFETSLGENGFSLDYERSKLARGVSITPEVSTDLVRWSTDGIRLLKQNETADLERWSAFIPTKESSQFLRLRFTVP